MSAKLLLIPVLPQVKFELELGDSPLPHRVFGVDPNSGFETETPPVRLRELSFLLKTTVSRDPKETFLTHLLSDGPPLTLLKDNSRFKPLVRIALSVETSRMVKTSVETDCSC